MDVLLAVDKAIGNAAERLVRAHHARRLHRLGWDRALDPPPDDLWAAGEPPPRPGCSLEVLVDGAEALPRIARELACARSHVHLAGWYVSPDFALTRDRDRITLRALLAGLAERVPVRVLRGPARRCRSSIPTVATSTACGVRSRSGRGSRSQPTRTSARSTAITRSSS